MPRMLVKDRRPQHRDPAERWVNRAGMPDEYPDVKPHMVARDLTGLVAHFAPG